MKNVHEASATPLKLRVANPYDAASICAIYNPYVADTVITFEEEPVAVDAMTRRIVEVTHTYPWLVAEAQGHVVGYSYAGSWRPRSAYRYSVETTIYIDRAHMGRGLGRLLYGALLDRLRVQGFHCAVGGIALPNPASIALHEKLGFHRAATLKEVGWKQSRWVDVEYWQRILG
jgi:phosphinothricin acetyltransferase